VARCEDYPCCGHESGCCPDFDDNGKQVNMKCVCGATVDINSRSSMCESCLRQPTNGDSHYDDREADFYDANELY